MPHPTLIYPQNRRASRATASSRPHLRRHPRPSPFAHIHPSKTAHDGNGNVRALVKADAANPAASAVVEKYAYDGFGRELPIATSSGLKSETSNLNSFRFSTKYFEPESGMSYYGYRFYAADAGRWVNRDLIYEDGGLNIYGALENNLIVKVDVNGLGEDLNGDGKRIAVTLTSDAKAPDYVGATMHIAIVVNFDCEKEAATVRFASANAAESSVDFTSPAFRGSSNTFYTRIKIEDSKLKITTTRDQAGDNSLYGKHYKFVITFDYQKLYLRALEIDQTYTTKSQYSTETDTYCAIAKACTGN